MLHYSLVFDNFFSVWKISTKTLLLSKKIISKYYCLWRYTVTLKHPGVTNSWDDVTSVNFNSKKSTKIKFSAGKIYYDFFHKYRKITNMSNFRIGSIKKSIQMNIKELKSLIHNRDEMTNNFWKQFWNAHGQRTNKYRKQNV